ncbi:uncharacterized protein [Acropora muricata]|uniref:uncharacterized protein isoform X4 n=1 Tax=Acropora muricata TaxID=159855 RepID=UPI0034E54880
MHHNFSCPTTSTDMANDHLDQQFQDIEEVLGKEMAQQAIQVAILDLKDVYDKFQRKGSSSEQRIANGRVTGVAWTTIHQVEKIEAFVQRTPEAANKVSERLYVGPMELKVTYETCELHRVNFSVDLDSLYKTPSGDIVYALDKVEVDERNVWQLVINVTLTGNDDLSSNANKRKRKDSGLSSPSRKDSVSSQASFEVPSPYSAINHGGSSCGSTTKTDREVLTDYLEAQRARIENLTVVNLMQTRRGDIAYHLNLTEATRRRPDLEEGDVIAFLANSKTGKTEIEKLSHENAQNAVMAGVVSRSAYLNANAPGNDFVKGTTDTVCVIGLVKVKVLGTVQNGERVYVSLNKPGVAVPETQIPLRPMADRTPALLGQAIESKESHSQDEVHLIQCFVSIVLGIQSGQIANAINNLQEKMQGSFEDVMVAERSRWLSGLRWKVLLFIVIAVLLSVVLYMFLAPGTWYQKLRCEKGRIKGHSAYFEFVSSDHQYPKVYGIEFTWQNLIDKLDLQECKRFNASGMHYYLNLARCEYFEKIVLDHKPQIRGPEIFAVDANCSKVFYVECDIRKWTQYTSARNIRCYP